MYVQFGSKYSEGFELLRMKPMDQVEDGKIEVVGPDSVGLLYRLARALTEFDVDVSGARIDTVGHDVVDSFYVTSYGGPIEDPELQEEIRRNWPFLRDRRIDAYAGLEKRLLD